MVAERVPSRIGKCTRIVKQPFPLRFTSPRIRQVPCNIEEIIFFFGGIDIVEGGTQRFGRLCTLDLGVRNVGKANAFT